MLIASPSRRQLALRFRFAERRTRCSRIRIEMMMGGETASNIVFIIMPRGREWVRRLWQRCTVPETSIHQMELRNTPILGALFL
jgi:hypothetical protein